LFPVSARELAALTTARAVNLLRILYHPIANFYLFIGARRLLQKCGGVL